MGAGSWPGRWPRSSRRAFRGKCDHGVRCTGRGCHVARGGVRRRGDVGRRVGGVRRTRHHTRWCRRGRRGGCTRSVRIGARGSHRADGRSHRRIARRRHVRGRTVARGLAHRRCAPVAGPGARAVGRVDRARRVARRRHVARACRGQYVERDGARCRVARSAHGARTHRGPWSRGRGFVMTTSRSPADAPRSRQVTAPAASTMRVCQLWCPDWPVVARRWLHPELRDVPVAVIGRVDGREVVVSASVDARARRRHRWSASTRRRSALSRTRRDRRRPGDRRARVRSGGASGGVTDAAARTGGGGSARVPYARSVARSRWRRWPRRGR